MKLGFVFRIFLVVFLMHEANGKSVVDSFVDMIFPRNPEVNRVRRIEDANGDPYAVLDTVGLVEQYGYSGEEHHLTTEDGYNIVFFRISGSPKSPPAKGKPIVFLQHGMFGSSDTWVCIGPHHDLAFLLSDVGYDIWLGNIRGNTYGRSHQNLSTSDKDFWSFSWQEAGSIDVPSMIDYALENTGQKTMFYIGISMGTTMSYVMLSEKPEYNDKMRLVVSLAPVGCWKHMSNILFQMATLYGPLIRDTLNSLGVYDIGAQTKLYAVMTETFCSSHSKLQPLCLAGLQLALPLVAGVPAKGFNISMLPLIVKYNPAGASGQTLIHYQQCYKSGQLMKYDHGTSENLRIYGTEKPPVYDLSKVSAPFVLIYGNTDQLALKKNVITLSKLLPNVVSCEAVPARVFNHLDFGISPYAKDLVYNRILELFAQH